ncbi:hypothetical protein [Blochmannia endosymbiont of Camponotus sp.]
MTFLIKTFLNFISYTNVSSNCSTILY